MSMPARSRPRSEEPDSDPDAARKARHVRVFERASEVLGEAWKAQEWLRIENWALGGITPESLLGTDCRMKEVEDLLGRIEHGVYMDSRETMMETKGRARPRAASPRSDPDPAELERLTALAANVLGDRKLAERWMIGPIRAFGGESPAAVAARPGGPEEVEAVLGRIAYGGYS